MTARHRVLLIDDEPLARQRLRQLLSQAPEFDVVAECDDGRQVVEAVRRWRPDVAFLDIRMPHVDGFAVQATLRGAVRHLVFVTAYPEHAARAFDVAAFDYLVKPVSQARFNATLDRIRTTLGGDAIQRVFLGSRNGGVAVAARDIVRVEAKGAYIVVHVGTERHILRESLGDFLDRLAPVRFVRIHRSVGVPVEQIGAVRRVAGGHLEVRCGDGTWLGVSRRQAREVLGALRDRHNVDRLDVSRAVTPNGGGGAK